MRLPRKMNYQPSLLSSSKNDADEQDESSESDAKSAGSSEL